MMHHFFIPVGTTVSDGEWIDVVLTNGSLVTKLANDSSVVNDSTEIFYQSWFSIVANKKLEIGSPSNSSKNKFFSKPYKGCFKGLFIGGVFYNLSGNGISKNTINNCTGDNVCSPSECVNGGECVDIFNDFICQCPQFYTKRTCNETINITCSFNNVLCENNATCINLNDTTARTPTVSQNGKDFFQCECPAGFTGGNCGINVDECTPDPCINSNNCIDGINDYSCNCTSGWEGKNCSEDIDECATNPCKNSGTCSNNVNSYSCDCTGTGYNGTNCTVNIDECSLSVCQNNATCNDTLGDYNCSCSRGYFGKNCQYSFTVYCEIKQPCQNNGMCQDNATDFSCNCTAGFEGKTCQDKVKDSGKDSDNTSCSRGYFGKNCQYNFTVYCEMIQPCQNNGICQDNATDFSCNCAAGFEGKTCQDKVKDSDNTGLIVGIVVGVVAFLILLMIFVYCVFNYCKEKSGMEGTYSPNKEEQQSGNVEMNSMKKPKPERLI